MAADKIQSGPKLTASSLARLKDLEKSGGTRQGGSRWPGLIDVPLPWRPYYLQRKILSAFFAIFAACIIVGEALLDYSGRNAGLLGQTNINLRYLCVLLPPAVMTVIATLWSRVEYQAKLSAPWLQLARGPKPADQTLLLDYFTMAPPMDAVRALKNGDVAVACASIIAMLLKVVIIVSAGMISLTVLEDTLETTPITLTTQFANNASQLATVGSGPLLTMLGLQRDNLTFPDGVSRQIAYQEFSSSITSAATQFLATVDGFSSTLNCTPGVLTVNSVHNRAPLPLQFNTTITAGGCTLSVPLVGQGIANNGTSVFNGTARFFARMVHASCGNASDEASQRIVVIYGTANFTGGAGNSLSGSRATIGGTISQSQQIVCTPSYTISHVDVVKNGSFVDSVAIDDVLPLPRMLPGVQPWDIAQVLFDSLSSSPAAAAITDVNTPYYTTGAISVNVDAAMYLAFGMQAQADALLGNDTTPPTSFFDDTTLQGLAQTYYQQYTAFVAHEALIQPASIATTCTAYIGGDRLVVGVVAVQIVAVLLAIILLFNVVTIFRVPVKGFLPRDPHSLLDIAALLSHSRSLLQALRGAGGADLHTLRSRLTTTSYYTGVEAYDRGSGETKQGYFRVFSEADLAESPAPEPVVAPNSGHYWPFTMHPAQRVLMYAILAGMIAGLEVTLRLSAKNGGLRNIIPGSQLHFVWTMVPALLMTVVAVFYATTDFHVRSLAPFAALARAKGAPIATMTCSLADRTTAMALYQAVRARNVAVAGAAAAVMVATLLPVFASSLFAALTIPISSDVQLITQDFFSNSTNPPPGVKTSAAAAPTSSCSSCLDGMTLASLVLDRNLSYPAFTFEDLAFPTLSIIPLIGVNGTDDLETTATVPAVRSSMTCQFFAQSDIGVNLTTSYRIGSIANPLRIDLPGEPSQGTSELQSSTLVIGTAVSPTNGSSPATSKPAIDTNALFGAAAYRPLQAADGSVVTHWVYAWGRLNGADTNQTTVQTISALACNETMQQLDVYVRLEGAMLAINPDRMVPQRMEATAKPSDAALSTTLNYTSLSSNLTGDTTRAAANLLDSFFTSLVSSQYAIPVADLGVSASGGSTTGVGLQNNTVAAAIVRQHGIIRAQVVNTFNRQPTTASSRSSDIFPLDAAGKTPIGNATQLAFRGHLTSVTDGKRRLIQDAPTTRVLQSLLGAVLLFSVVSWAAFPGALERRPGGSRALPRPATSIASVAALLVDGNVFAFFGRGPEWQTAEELPGALRNGLHVTADFTLGWTHARRRWRGRSMALAQQGQRPGTSVGGGSEGGNNRAASVYGAYGPYEQYGAFGRDTSDDGQQELFGINATRTGGWGGGENVGLGLQARVGYAQRRFVYNWGQRK